MTPKSIKELVSRPGSPSRATVYRDIKAGALPAYKVRGSTIIFEEDWRCWLSASPVRMDSLSDNGATRAIHEVSTAMKRIADIGREVEEAAAKII